MRNSLIILGISAFMAPCMLQAGNPERAGQAGASELLINPWARSTGFSGMNTSLVKGVEAMSVNMGGLAFNKGTEVSLTRTQWFQGSGININAFGVAQKVGESGNLGVAITNVNYGDIKVTTEEQPEGGLGTMSYEFLTFGLAYGHTFSNSIYGGTGFKLISAGVPNVRAQGFALDAGIQYVTGPRDRTRFGIALRNIGPKMKYTGDGMSFLATTPSGQVITGEMRSQGFEMPALINLGASYDLYLDQAADHRITGSWNFISHSFIDDQLGFGYEYGYKNFLMVRGGYVYQPDNWSSTDSRTSYTGWNAGVTFEIPMGEEDSRLGFDYSYRQTWVWQGTHSIGLRMAF